MMFFTKHPLKGMKIMVGFAVALLFVAAIPASVMASKSKLTDVVAKKSPAPLYLTLGKADLIQVSGPVADVLVANPSVIDVMAVQSNSLYVVGLTIGDTNIIALDAEGNVLKRLDVHVTYDLVAVQGLVDSLFPKESVKVGAIHNQILLTGDVSTPEVATKVMDVVGHYASGLLGGVSDYNSVISNMMGVRGEQQVMLQVKIVEATRSVLKELGLETDLNNTSTATTTVFGVTPSASQFGSASTASPQEFQFRTGGGIALSQTAAGAARFLFDSGISGIGAIGLFLNALEDENLVNVLAEPNLTAVSGEQAGFLAGGQFPVPVGRDQIGNLVVQFRDFGVSLNFRPIVLSEDRISLQLNTEVSSLDFDNALPTGDNVVVPGLDVRRAETTVEIASGASLMIAGLLQSETIQGMSGLPGISDTPILGDLVSSDSFQRDETELVVIVTAYLVEPYAEQNRADKQPRHRNNPLAQAFVANVRRGYEVEDESIFDQDEKFGYLLD